MKKIFLFLCLCIGILPIANAQDEYTATAELPNTHFAANGDRENIVVPMDNVRAALDEFTYSYLFEAYATIVFFNEAGEELSLASSSPLSSQGISANINADGNLSITVRTNDQLPAAIYHLGIKDEYESLDLRANGYNFTIELSFGEGSGSGTSEYTASAELPATHFPMSSSTQRIIIPMDNVKTALEAVEEGLYDEMFPAYTNVYFLNEAGEELTVPNAWGGNGLSAYTTTDGLTVSVPAETQFDAEVFHLGKLNTSTSAHEDLRDAGYNFTIQLSAGETMPVITTQSDAEESIIEPILDLTPFENAAGDRFDEIFVYGTEYVLLDENGATLEGVSVSYGRYDGFYLLIAPKTSVTKGYYYLATVNDDGSYTDWRDEGLSLYIVLTVDAPLLSEYEAEPIVIDDYDVYSPQTIDGYAESLISLLGENLFSNTFASGQTYKFRLAESGEIIEGVSLNLRTDTNDKYYFEILISSESVSVDNQRVQLTGFDWNIGDEGAAVDLDIDIFLNLTIAAREAVTGTLPATHLQYTGESATGTISLADLKTEWDSQNPSYFTEAFVDGNIYGLYDAEYNMPNVEMLYSAEKNALEVTCFDNTVAENTYYLMNLMTYATLASMGYDVSIVFSVEDATSIDDTSDNTLHVIGNDGKITIETSSPAIVYIYNLSGQQVTAANIDNAAAIQLPAGIYLVRVNEEVCKAIVK